MSDKKCYSRRDFMGIIAASGAAPFALSVDAKASTRHWKDQNAYVSSQYSVINPHHLNDDSERVFSLSIASGDPTETGVILWTRIDPRAHKSYTRLSFQVARDEGFEQLVLEGHLTPWEIREEKDLTVKVDLDGHLQPGTRYYYRFIYDDTVSRVGRCRTLPPEDQRLDRVKLAVLTCQDYTNGYYGAYDHIATDDSIDFVLHLGDFIYESAADPRFQSLPFEDRQIILPSDYQVAMNLRDFRHLYSVYRSDRNIQKAMENHTFIITTDDHETANDCYWDYERDTLGAPDHPFVTDEAFVNNPDVLRELKIDSQRAWLEYTPTRVEVNESKTHPHDFSKVYRSFKFGQLAEVFMMDTRTYRTAHPCGEGDAFERYLPQGCDGRSSEQSMLGEAQRDWLTNGVVNSTRRWQVLGNQTYMGQFGATFLGQKVQMINMDAWDGYEEERKSIMQTFSDNDIHNLVVLTGDFHSYMASQVKVNYNDLAWWKWDNHVGVEFMTPSITSSSMVDLIAGKLEGVANHADVINCLAEGVIKLNNPHIKFFNSKDNGYSTVEYTDNYVDWTAYKVNKNHKNGSEKTVVAKKRKHQSWPWLMDA